MLVATAPSTHSLVQYLTMAPLDIIIVGAGLGGLSAAISIKLSGHNVIILESAKEIAEVGAGIQLLPNATRIMFSYGLKDELLKISTHPEFCHMNSWKGYEITRMSFHEHGDKYGFPFLDFHRADLQAVLLKKARKLGIEIHINARVVDIKYNLSLRTATAITTIGDKFTGDLIIGADGINSKIRDLIQGFHDPPIPTGDSAWRLLIPTDKMTKDPELKKLVDTPQVNYWIGPDAHCVNYILKSGKFLNFVLLCPDTVPKDVSICPGDIQELQNFFKGWDPRIEKLISLCPHEVIDKWKLCFRAGIDNWSHPSNLVTLLGDSVHATLPYLASGAGMAIEDGAVIGECFKKAKSKDDLPTVLKVYESCRKLRTERIVARGNKQQHLYHLYDGEEQRERDRILSMPNPPAGETFVWRDREMAPWLLGYNVEKDVAIHWTAVTAK